MERTSLRFNFSYHIHIVPFTILLSFVLPLLCSPLSASAFDIAPGVVFSKQLVGSNIRWQDGNSTTWHNGSSNYFYGNTADYPGNNRLFTISNTSHNFSVSSGQWVVVSGNFFAATNYQMEINSSGIIGISNATADCSIVDFELSPVIADNTTSTQTYNYNASFNLTCRATSAISIGPTINLALNNIANPGVSSYGISFTNVLVFSSDKSLSDVRNSIQDIYSWLNNSDIKDDLHDISINTYNTHSVLEDILRAEEDAEDGAQARYDDEKQTINDAANDAKDEVDNQNFGFTIPNPLSVFFANFKGTQCVSISGLSSWIHSNETQVCSPWPSNVRSVMTSVFTGLFSLVLFRFFVTWVKGKDSSD